MSFVDHISRSPLPYDTRLASDVAVLFEDGPAPLKSLLEGTAGCSPYLAGLIEREAVWLGRLAHEDAEDLLEGVWQDIEQASGDLKLAFRVAKRRVAVLAALADLGGVWPLGTVTRSLTELADRCLHKGLTQLVGTFIARGKLRVMTPGDGSTAAGMCILAMGKMGAYELNYSSDIDLICLFDETRFDPDDYQEARSSFVKITRQLMGLMSEVTADGYVFRTDLRLRPDASVTPVCIAMEAAERYYESVGRTWERAAFIKARPCAGDLAAGEAFLQRLSPFVWRKHLDFAAIQDAHDMRLRIRDHKGLGGQMTLEGHNMKLGAGGIREIEFFTQTRQLIAGGRDAALRSRETLNGLQRLSDAGWVPESARAELSAAYVAHREVEHRLQMIGDAQTHDLPKTDEGFDRLARFMGDADTAHFRQTLMARLEAVADVTDSFFAPEEEEAEAPASLPSVREHLTKWNGYPALRSERAVTLFKRVFPPILARMEDAPRPAEALAEFERFLAGLPAGVQLFSLFDANPQLAQLIVDICATAPALATYLSRNSGVLDAVIGGGFFAPWPEQVALQQDLDATLKRASDYEAQLDGARRWQKEWHFRIGVHHLQGLISSDEAAAQYADLAQATLAAVLPCVEAQFAAKHGSAPGRGAMVLAMGSLGAGRLTAASDLDVIVIYDAQGVEQSDGPRPLETRSYFARLTQGLITALTAPMAQGRLYEVDLRLRPSGQSGPVATSLASFDSYQRGEAWVWEHLALTRARPIAGDAGFCAEVEVTRCDILRGSFDANRIKQETREMRQRLAEAGRSSGAWDVKQGPGGLQDIELCAQALGLMARAEMRDIAGLLRAAQGSGFIGGAQVTTLLSAYDLESSVLRAARLLTDKPLDPDRIGAGGVALLLRECGCDDVGGLSARLMKCRKQAAEVVELVLA